MSQNRDGKLTAADSPTTTKEAIDLLRKVPEHKQVNLLAYGNAITLLEARIAELENTQKGRTEWTD